MTFSCYHRLPHLQDERLRDLFVECLERMRRNYRFRVYAYVVMPEHVHLLVSEPEGEVLAKAIQALKISVARRATSYRAECDVAFWQKRYYVHNVRTYESFVEKLRYIHRNPVKRGLVDWKWSSFRHYATAEIGPVEIEVTVDRRPTERENSEAVRDSRAVKRDRRPTSAKGGQMWGTVERRAETWATSRAGEKQASGQRNGGWPTLSRSEAVEFYKLGRAVSRSAAKANWPAPLGKRPLSIDEMNYAWRSTGVCDKSDTGS